MSVCKALSCLDGPLAVAIDRDIPQGLSKQIGIRLVISYLAIIHNRVP